MNWFDALRRAFGAKAKQGGKSHAVTNSVVTAKPADDSDATGDGDRDSNVRVTAVHGKAAVMTHEMVPYLHRGVIVPTLEFMARESGRAYISSQDAQAILLGIAATESALKFTRQIARYTKADANGKRKKVYGPARSYFQAEPSTARDVIHRYRKKDGMGDAIVPILPQDVSLSSKEFLEALRYSAPLGCMCARLKLMDDPRALPAWHDVEGQAAIWKRIYNSHLGAGEEKQYVEAVEKFGIDAYLLKEFGPVSA